MQQSISNITLSDRCCCTLIRNILPLFHFIVHGMIWMSCVHFKEIYFILYAIQESVFEDNNKQWNLNVPFSNEKVSFKS